MNLNVNFNPLKRIFKSALNNDPFEQIFWDNPTAKTYTNAINNYNSMTVEQRCNNVNRCLNKLTKPKQMEQIIADLVLLHQIMKIDWVNIGKKQIEIGQQKSKDKIAEANFIKFYYKFIVESQDNVMNNRDTLQTKIEYAQNYINKCLNIIKIGFVIDYCIAHSSNQLIIRIALKDIFEDIRSGLQFVTNFIQNNAQLIYQQNDDNAFSINEIYENLLYINKNIHKITVLIKKAELQINLPLYQLNKQLNMKIELQMNARKSQKMVFKTQKVIGKAGLSQKKIKSQSQKNKPCCQSMNEIYLDEDQILLEHDQLLY